ERQPRRDTRREVRPQHERAAAGAPGGAARRPGAVRVPADGAVRRPVRPGDGLPEKRVPRDAVVLRGGVDAVHLADVVPPAQLPPARQGAHRRDRVASHGARARGARTGDDRRGRARDGLPLQVFDRVDRRPRRRRVRARVLVRAAAAAAHPEQL
ncbi:MAG: hypothetical protein AVDCRST_MAG85-3433, partial [uncultured Solirubrobacteraceae bacterium]